MTSDKHIFKTYMKIRIGIAILAVLLPLSLISYGYFIDIGIQGSLSSYYHASPDAHSYHDFHSIQKGQFLRTFFVGLLITIGALLYFYKGFHPKENIVLNFAGGFAVLVALFPMHWEDSIGNVLFKAVEFGEWFSVHGISAVLLVFCVAYVCIFRPSKTTDLLKDEKLKNRLIILYNILGGLMILLPISIFVILSFFVKNGKAVIWVEIAVLVVFAIFWLAKSKEMSIIHKDNDSSDTLSSNFIS